LHEDSFEYSGEVALCKGDGVARDQLNLQNKLVQQQLAQQKAVMDKLDAAVGGDLAGKNGFSPELLAALKSQFLNQNDSAYNSAGSNVRSALASRGFGTGELPEGGEFARNIAELEGSRAGSQSQGLLGVDIESARQAINNKYNAASVLSGNSAQLGSNVGTFNSGASNSLNQYVWAANQGFGNAFTTALGGSLGKTIGSGLGGGLSGILGGGGGKG
jgi:hypothetical protein